MASKVIRELLTKIGYKVDYGDLDKAIQKTDRLKKSSQELKNSLMMQKAKTDQLQRSQRSLSVTSSTLRDDFSSLMSLSQKIAIGFTAVGAAFGFIMKQTGDMEQAEVAMQGLLQSEEKATKMMTDLKKLAVETPFELKDVFKGTNQLLAYNIGADEMIDTLTALGNVASVVGTEKLPNLILAYGQVSTAGKLRGQEVRQFTEAGVPVNEIIAKQMKVTKAEVSDLVSAGKVSFEIVQAAIQDYANGTGKATGAMEKQSKTLHGRISNLKDIIAITSAEIGKEFLPFVKGVILEMTNWISVNKELIRGNLVKYFKIAANAFMDFVAIAKASWITLSTLTKVVGGFENAVVLAGKALAIFFGGKMLLMMGKFVLGFKNISNAMFAMQVKAAFIPLAIGAAIVGTMLLIDDFIHWTKGNKSILGNIFGDFEGATSPLAKLFSMDFVEGTKKTILYLWEWIKQLFSDLFTKQFWSERLADLKSAWDDIFNQSDENEQNRNATVNKMDDSMKEEGFFFNMMRRFMSGTGAGMGAASGGDVNIRPGGMFDNLTKPINKGAGTTTINNSINVPQGTTKEQAKHIVDETNKSWDNQLKRAKAAIPVVAH